MADTETPHIIILKLNSELTNEPDFDPTENAEWIHWVICPYKKDDPDRPCRCWYECNHKPLFCGCVVEDTDPCDISPSEEHRYIRGVLSYPSDECYVQVCEYTVDEIWRLIEKHNLGIGKHKVTIEDTDENFIYLELVTGE